MKENTTCFRLNVNDKIHLTDIRESDRNELVLYLNNEQIYQRSLRIPFPYTAADADKFLGIMEKERSVHNHPVHFAIRDLDERLIGGVGMDVIVPGHCTEIGYWLGQPFWGHGLMTETVRAFCPFVMDRWNLVRVTAHVFSFNSASARVLEKCGFQREGFLRKQFRKDGNYIDSILYALVR